MKHLFILTWIIPFCVMSAARAASSSEETQKLQPYIESLKKTMPDAGERSKSEGFTREIQRNLKPDASAGKSYIEEIKKTDPHPASAGTEESYTEIEKKKLSPPAKELGAIEAVSQGKSTLELKRTGKITGAAGFRVGINNSRTARARGSVKASEFSSVYKEQWVPDLTLFGEYQPFHSEWYGNIGIIGSLGYAQFRGRGNFENPNITNGATGQTIGAQSRTQFRFNVIPLSLGLNYRFNLFRYVRPYIAGSGVGMLFFETRSDGKDGNRGRSLGFMGTVGVAFLLDFLNRSTTWDLYAENNVKHTYVTLEYSRLKTTSGEVEFEFSGVYTGLTFEF